MKIKLCDICGKDWKKSQEAYVIKRKTFSLFDSFTERLDVCSECMSKIIKICERYELTESGVFKEK